jgi:hypothetical protein
MESILLFSDIHADIGALDEILRLAYSDDFSDRYGPVTGVVNLGDILERGHAPLEVIDRLESLAGLRSILGNHDQAFLWKIPVSGSDDGSELAHEAFRATGRHERFFHGMAEHVVDQKNHIFAVHGGPVDPASVTPPGSRGIEAWLYTMPWQRISDIGARYLDGSGYHYLPPDAFDAVRAEFEGRDFVLVCGHEHEEAAYCLRGGVVEDVLGGLDERPVRLCGRDVREKRLPVEKNSSYLVRLGLAGPEGYGEYGRDRCYFGVYSAGPEPAMCLLSFTPDRRHGRLP